jgi:hypothetical protein
LGGGGFQDLQISVLEGFPSYARQNAGGRCRAAKEQTAISDFHLFGPLKEALTGHRFADHDEVKEAVHDWLRTQPKRFF